MIAGKQTRDLRGPQARIARLLPFLPEGFIHVLVYRIKVPLAVLYGALIFTYLLAPGWGTALKIATAVMWVLWTPQLFEVAKGLALAWSRGMSFGRLNAQFAALYRKRHPGPYALLTALPFVVLAVWAAAFILLLVRWHP